MPGLKKESAPQRPKRKASQGLQYFTAINLVRNEQKELARAIQQSLLDSNGERSSRSHPSVECSTAAVKSDARHSPRRHSHHTNGETKQYNSRANGHAKGRHSLPCDAKSRRSSHNGDIKTRSALHKEESNNSQLKKNGESKSHIANKGESSSSKRNAEKLDSDSEVTERRPKRVAAQRAAVVTNLTALLQQEEHDLKRAIQQSLNEAKAAKKKPIEDLVDELLAGERTKQQEEETRKKLSKTTANGKESSSSTTSTRSSDCFVKKPKIPPRRKFAQGTTNYGSSSSTPIKLRPVPPPVPATEVFKNIKPNTADFLTFLCFRGSPMLPPQFDFVVKELEAAEVKAKAKMEGREVETPEKVCSQDSEGRTRSFTKLSEHKKSTNSPNIKSVPVDKRPDIKELFQTPLKKDADKNGNYSDSCLEQSSAKKNLGKVKTPLTKQSHGKKGQDKILLESPLACLPPVNLKRRSSMADMNGNLKSTQDGDDDHMHKLIPVKLTTETDAKAFPSINKQQQQGRLSRTIASSLSDTQDKFCKKLVTSSPSDVVYEQDKTKTSASSFDRYLSRFSVDSPSSSSSESLPESSEESDVDISRVTQSLENLKQLRQSVKSSQTIGNVFNLPFGHLTDIPLEGEGMAH
ncbi:Protein Jumonji [Halotydeus destructor]|nr:Protein Jumonji [Halotydeus destructor]